MRRVVSVLVGVLLCASLAGCVRETAGAATSPEAPATEVRLPPRPRDIDIRNVDPCSLLTEFQRAELGLDGEPNYDVARSPLFEGPEPACTTSGYSPRAVAVGVALPHDGLGADAFAAYRVRSTVTIIEVQGFPAVQAVQPESVTSCTVVVDLAPGQAMNVQYRDGGGRPPVPPSDLCPGAVDVADAAMRTLLELA
ncbi:DUF3558 domain-containing protein [Pseudonocardia sp. KRD-184]|uniref:DUF3558 domain-containing protein n=1 Tax=Pseudonocardia oceani TaxID=2792013 RepID=A0ABS6UFR3_9PSEU|nr:DUF3558 domain-containing protein [Pseudonocardia oceani]MBW0090173.1 DUF3558 domain-containing protein [Pseudonocardia oceani]MBW0097335.1 DUF3558 domain-containing protein [Pseudonocardia oceani]MBW0110457.1 DUF3558 domain-containing protein [Pseudonocardia oceani]MBW0121229.1 DUF3558 domain-containing protein [Pseudonocardia oceani]MBW0131082.1 DUF3558 domain-containing protein [Pseudonocardia oceani]